MKTENILLSLQEVQIAHIQSQINAIQSIERYFFKYPLEYNY
jgi:hypothetical protein